jgi:hypothetical protein
MISPVRICQYGTRGRDKDHYEQCNFHSSFLSMCHTSTTQLRLGIPAVLLALSRDFLENLVDAARYRLGIFSGHLVSKRRQLLALITQHFELLVRMRRPKFDDIRWRLGRRDLLREIENRLDVSPSHIDHLEVKRANIFQRDEIALFNCSG